jgi:predicted secreted Zn-dependent protease
VPVNALRARGKPLIGLGEYFRVLRKTATDLDKRL